MRASKNVNNNTAVFIYDGKEILAETTSAGTKTNIFGNNMIATTGTDTLYYQYNNHGDVVGVLDESGTLKNEYDYDAFGNAITEKETVKNPYRYAGYYQDTESGLYYLRSRYYNPKTARFLTEDTASGKYTDPLSLNKYTYCHNQPVTGYDPDGHALHIVLGAAIGGVIGAVSSLYEQRDVIGTGSYSYKKYWGSVAEGAITGAVTAATGGANLAAAAGGTALKTAAKTGAIDIPGGEAGEKTAKEVGSEIIDKIGDSFKKKAGNEVVESAGANVAKKALNNSADAGIGNTGIGALPSKQIAPDATNMPKTDFFAGPGGVAKSLDEYDAFAKGGSTSSIGNGKQYSVMFQANTGSGKSRSAHRNAANKQFYNQMKNNPEFKGSVDDYFGYDVMEYMKSGKGSLKNPSSDWVWHHSAESTDVIQLIPKKQHQASELQSILHPGPNGEGGFGLYY